MLKIDQATGKRQGDSCRCPHKFWEWRGIKCMGAFGGFVVISHLVRSPDLWLVKHVFIWFLETCWSCGCPIGKNVTFSNNQHEVEIFQFRNLSGFVYKVVSLKSSPTTRSTRINPWTHGKPVRARTFKVDLSIWWGVNHVVAPHNLYATWRQVVNSVLVSKKNHPCFLKHPKNAKSRINKSWKNWKILKPEKGWNDVLRPTTSLPIDHLRRGKEDAADLGKLWQIVILTSIVLTNSRLPSPWVTKAENDTPRGTCTRRFFSRQNGRRRDGDIEGRYTNDGMYFNKWQYCLHMCRLYEVFFWKCENNCIEWVSAWKFFD